MMSNYVKRILCHNLQAIFHFKSYRISNPKEPDCDPDEDELIDDTRTLHSGPFELLIDREFKVKVWENAVKTMKIKEVARFGCEFKVRTYQIDGSTL